MPRPQRNPNPKPRRAERRRADRGTAPSLPRASSVGPLLVVAAGLVAYHGDFGGAFVFDDIQAIVVNPSIRSFSWATLSPPVRSAVTGRPVANLSLAVNYAIGGLDVTGYHVFNVATHLLAALVLLGVVRRTLELPALRDRFGTAAPWIATTVALLWVVHPLLTESVSYVVQRTESLMGLFYFVTLYCAIRGAESLQPQAWYAAAVVASGLGMGCKEIMATAPFVLLAYDRLFLSDSFRDCFRRRGVLYGSLVAVVTMMVAFASARIQRGLPALTSGRLSPWDYAKSQTEAIVHYLRLSIWPHPLAFDYSDWPVRRSLFEVLPWALVVVALLGLVVWGLSRRAPLAFLGVWFFAILAPTSSFFPLRAEVVAERRMYLPLAAVITLVVLGAHRVLRDLFPRPTDATRRRLVAGVVVGAIVAAFVGLTVTRIRAFRTPLAFWTAAVAGRPAAPRARVNLGDVLFKAGRKREALEQYAEAVRVAPGDPLGQYGLGVTLGSQGKTDEALEHYLEALRLDPGLAEAHNNAGAILEIRGKLAEAEEHYRAALEAKPNYATARYNLGNLLEQQGRAEEAIGHFEAALEVEPGMKDARAGIERARRRAR